MEYSKFDSWIKQIMETEEEEISCSQCFELVSDYVDWEETGQPMPENLKKVKQHLNQCRVCKDEYEILHDIASMSDDRQNPLPGESPELTR